VVGSRHHANELLPVFVCELSERVGITSDGHAIPYFWVPGFDSVWPPKGVLDAQPVPAHLGTPVGFSLHHVEVAGVEPWEAVLNCSTSTALC
jgi:hypothetical protein